MKSLSSSSPVLAVPGLRPVVVSVVFAVAEGGVGPLPGVAAAALPLGLGAVALLVVVPPVRAAAVPAALVLVGVVPQPLQVCRDQDAHVVNAAVTHVFPSAGWGI